MGALLSGSAMDMKPGTHTAKSLLTALLLAAIAAPTLHALEFEPTFIETEVEGGYKNLEVVLKDGNAKVVYCPPPGWQAAPGPRRLRFFPRTVSLADLTIESDKAEPGRIVDAATLDRLHAWLKSSVPPESSDTVLEDDEAGLTSVASFPTFGMTVAYTSGGVRYRKRVIFVLTPDSNLRFTTVARVADFDRIYQAVRQSLFTWRWERPR
jgi:hypothetical protein